MIHLKIWDDKNQEAGVIGINVDLIATIHPVDENSDVPKGMDIKEMCMVMLVDNAPFKYVICLENAEKVMDRIINGFRRRCI